MSNGAGTTLSVCVRDHAACIRVVGRANYTVSVDFKRIVQQLQETGCGEIVLDLRECRLMDSTFLGVLASIATRCEVAREQGQQCVVELFRPSERVADLIDSLGVLKLFRLIEEAPPFDCFQPIEEGQTSKIELTRTCYEAHEMLRHTSPENDRRFKDAAELFQRNLDDVEKKP